ncbi:hypothetical protein Hanom_Chr14g01258301 [Helianthus anomalus]
MTAVSRSPPWWWWWYRPAVVVVVVVPAGRVDEFVRPLKHSVYV